MQDAGVVERIRRKFEVLRSVMDERTRRRWAEAAARELGWGGVSAVAKGTGFSRTTITAGPLQIKPRSLTASVGG